MTRQPVMESLIAPRSDWIREALERFEGPLTRYALHLTGNLERARDVVQDTFVALLGQEAAAVEPHLAPWLFRVCRNRALDVERKERRMTPVEEGHMDRHPSQAPSPPRLVEHHELHQQVLAQLESLPPDQREVIRLKFQNDFSYRQISEVTGLTISNVGYLIHTALRTLRARLGAHQE